MINIILNESTNEVEIESETFKITNVEDIGKLIIKVIQVYQFSGEAVCLEKKDIFGNYTMIERW